MTISQLTREATGKNLPLTMKLTIKIIQLGGLIHEIFRITKRRELYLEILKKEQNINELSKKIDLSYQNTHAHIKKLEAEGLIKAVDSDKRGKHEKIIIPAKNVNHDTIVGIIKHSFSTTS